MRGKKAKDARRIAESLTVGKPARAYYQEQDGRIFLDPGCTRWMYKEIKKTL